MLVPYGVLASLTAAEEISAFSYAFKRAGLSWMSYIVSFCACMGIVSNVGIVLFGASRVLVAVCRERLLPPRLGEAPGLGSTPLGPDPLLCGAVGVLLAVCRRRLLPPDIDEAGAISSLAIGFQGLGLYGLTL